MRNKTNKSSGECESFSQKSDIKNNPLGGFGTNRSPLSLFLSLPFGPFLPLFLSFSLPFAIRVILRFLLMNSPAFMYSFDRTRRGINCARFHDRGELRTPHRKRVISTHPHNRYRNARASLWERRHSGIAPRSCAPASHRDPEPISGLREEKKK